MIYTVKTPEVPMGGFVVGLAVVSKPNKEGEVFIEGIQTLHEGHGDCADVFGALMVLVSIARTGQDVYFFYNEFDDLDFFGIDDLEKYLPDDDAASP